MTDEDDAFDLADLGLAPGAAIGRKVDPETLRPIDVPEWSHFARCDGCGGMLDRRDLGQVVHHDRAGHAARSDPAWERVKASAGPGSGET